MFYNIPFTHRKNVILGGRKGLFLKGINHLKEAVAIESVLKYPYVC